MKNIILIPTDFSKVCTEAVHYGAQLAKKENTSIAIVHIVNKESVSKLSYKDNREEQIQKTLNDLETQVKIKDEINIFG